MIDAAHTPANARRRIRVKDVIRETAAEFAMPEHAMLRRTRQRDFVLVRQVAMFVAREMTPCSYPRLGVLFGEASGQAFDHSTVLYAHDRIAARLGRDTELSAHVARIRARLIA